MSVVGSYERRMEQFDAEYYWRDEKRDERNLEPGGQFELSVLCGSVTPTVKKRERTLSKCVLAAEKGYGFAGIGFDPKHSVENPDDAKGRYNIMKNYMPSRDD